jgi:uncharacterized membrane protein YfcA
LDFGSIADVLTRLVLGFGIGFIIGMTGIGAGVLLLPSLIYIIGLSPVYAVGTGLLYATLARAYGVYEHLRLHTVRKRTAFYIILGGVPAVLATSFVITRLSKAFGSNLDFALKIVISVVILVTWALMLLNLIRHHRGGSQSYYVPLEEFPLRRKLYGIAAGAGVGILIGATSTGGGVVMVPILVTVFGLSPNNTVGTSVLIGIVMAGLGAFAYLLGGRLNTAVAVTMFAGSVPGVLLGCRASVKVPHKVLSAILFAVITISMIVMFVGMRY